MQSDQDRFEAVNRNAVPRIRRGKHWDLVERIVHELDRLPEKQALKIPKAALGSVRLPNIRAALSRACSRQQISVATSTDDEYFYVWRQDAE